MLSCRIFHSTNRILISVKRDSLRIPNYCRCLSSASYPAHVVVNMPSLSPTMESGTIGKWLCQVGDEIKAGSAMAEIETDKASMTFEAQDEFYIAKLLCDVGQEVKVGQPILVTVDDKTLLPAFTSFTLSSPITTSPPVDTKKAEATVPQPVISAPIPSTPVVIPEVPTKVITINEPSVPSPTIKQPVVSSPPTVTAAKKDEVKKTTIETTSSKASKPSPLIAKFRKDQLSYIEKYGRSCHRVIQK